MANSKLIQLGRWNNRRTKTGRDYTPGFGQRLGGGSISDKKSDKSQVNKPSDLTGYGKLRGLTKGT